VGFKKRPSQTGDHTPKQYAALTRFIFDTGHFYKKEPRKPKPNAFLPGPDLRTSALGKNGMTDDEVWAIGALVGQSRGKAPKARADFDSGAVRDAKLTIEHDPIPRIPDHVNLCGWRTEKDEQKSAAQVLCARSKLVLAAQSPALTMTNDSSS
jgi:hypothetical protein